MTGTTWVEESGFLEGPIMITNTHSVGVVRDAVIEWQYKNKYYDPLARRSMVVMHCFRTPYVRFNILLR